MKKDLFLGVLMFGFSLALTPFVKGDTLITNQDGSQVTVVGSMVSLQILAKNSPNPSPSVSPSPSPTPSPTASPSPSQPKETASGASMPPLTQILDQNLGVWTVTAGVIALNGGPTGVTKNVILLFYFNHQVYQENQSLGWWVWQGGAWVATSDPRQNPLPSPSASSQGGLTPIQAPLTGNVAQGQWVVNQQQAFSGNPSGHASLQYNYLLPSGYNAAFIYPLMLIGGGNDQGMNGGSYPRDGASFVSAIEGAGFTFNTVTFRTAHPAIVVAVQCDQTLDSSGANGNANCGGYADSPNGGWNEQAILAVVQHMEQNFNVDTSRVYGVGLSLSAIGFLANLVDNNQQYAGGKKLWTAAVGMSEQLFRSTPNSSVYPRMTSVPYLAISTPSDNSPSSYDQPFWQFITGNSNYPTKAQYDSGGMAAIRAGSSQFYYIAQPGGSPWNTFGPMNADGGDGTALYQWLFSQSSAAPQPTPSASAQPSGNFQIKGGWVIDPNGKKFVSEGVNLYWDPGDVSSLEANLKSLMPKANHVRVIVSPTSHSASSWTYSPASDYLAFANWCQAQGVVCEFEDHSSNGGYWEGGIPGGLGATMSAPPTGTSLQQNLAFWSTMATQFKGNPYAWIGSLNELCPNNCDYTQGGSISTYELALYNAIRATGNQNIVSLEGGTNGNPGSVGPALGFDPKVYLQMTNIVYWMHSYYDGSNAQVLQDLVGSPSSNSGYTAQQQLLSKDGIVPVNFNEYGSGNANPNQSSGSAIVSAMQTVKASGIGGVGFVWYNPNGVPDYSMTNSGTSLTTWGKLVANMIQAVETPLSLKKSKHPLKKSKSSARHRKL